MATSISINRSSLISGVFSLISLSSLCAASPSYAQIDNSGFETGAFTGWTTTGDTSIETAEFGVEPTEGTYEALITTGSGSVFTPELETFLGIEPGSLDDLGNGITYNGSAIKQTITANAGDVLTFDWSFLTNEEPETVFNDYAFVSLDSMSSTLASTLSSSFGYSSAAAFDLQNTPQTSSFTIPTSGTYTLGLGVANVTDTTGVSGLSVDNVSIEPVPEPSSVLGTLVLAGLGLERLLKRKQQSARLRS